MYINNYSKISLEKEKYNPPIRSNSNKLKGMKQNKSQEKNFNNSNYNKNKKSKEELNNEAIDKEILDLLFEDIDNNNNEKDIKNNIFKNISLEVEFNYVMEKDFSFTNQKSDNSKIIKDILYAINTYGNKINEPKINGPYLVGSYRTISELSSIKYTASIDIMYTYKNILNKNIKDDSIYNLLCIILNLDIFEICESYEDSTKITHINVKCKNKIEPIIIIPFHLLLVDVGFEYNN